MWSSSESSASLDARNLSFHSATLPHSTAISLLHLATNPALSLRASGLRHVRFAFSELFLTSLYFVVLHLVVAASSLIDQVSVANLFSKKI